MVGDPGHQVSGQARRFPPPSSRYVPTTALALGGAPRPPCDPPAGTVRSAHQPLTRILVVLPSGPGRRRGVETPDAAG